MYTEYMTVGEYECNAAKNSVAKSIELIFAILVCEGMAKSKRVKVELKRLIILGFEEASELPITPKTHSRRV